MGRPADKTAKLFANFVQDKKIVIADSSSASRAGLARAIIGLGAKTPNVVMTTSYEGAQAEIEKHKPQIIITDYDLGKRCGLDLLQEQRKQNPDTKNNIFVLVTGNTSQSAVAQAAEEDVDTFVLKPYTLEILRNSIMQASIAKIYPSDYVKAVDAGKELMFGGKLDEAIAKFDEAKTLDSKPSLACFYHGQAEFLKKAMDEAKGDYEAGLKHNKIHYKCMVGLFDLLMAKEEYKEAYSIIRKIARYFPANPERLTSVLRLAVMTQSYDDIERYYQLFTQMDQRNDQLIKYVCAALVVCGKFYLFKNYSKRANELFQKAAITASGRTRILREIISSLVEYELLGQAETYLTRFPADQQDKADFLAMELVICDKQHPPGVTIDRGRKIIAKGIEDPSVYTVMVKKYLETGLDSSADELIQKAVAKFPNLQESFDKIKQETPEKK